MVQKPANLFSKTFAVILLLFPMIPQDGLAQEAAVRFDVPALVEACEVLPAANTGLLTDEQLVQIVLPLSCWVTPDERREFEEFRFDVHWNRNVCPLVDYSPRTLMQSPVNGVVATENQTEHSLKAALDLKSTVVQVQPGAHLEGGTRNSETTRFEEIPQHEMLVASGTIQRGTGAFFRYHPSRQYALEGGREVSLVWRVPRSWRGGILRVVCQADGHKKGFAGFREPVSASSAFIVAAYLKGDGDARNIASDYIRHEQQLRAVWAEHLRTVAAAKPRTLLAHFQQAGQGSSSRLAAGWVSDLVQSPLSDQLDRDAKLLPAEVRMAAEDFVAAREKLFQLGWPDRPATATGLPPASGVPAAAPQSAWHTRSPTSVVE